MLPVPNDIVGAPVPSKDSVARFTVPMFEPGFAPRPRCIVQPGEPLVKTPAWPAVEPIFAESSLIVWVVASGVLAWKTYIAQSKRAV